VARKLASLIRIRDDIEAINVFSVFVNVESAVVVSRSSSDFPLRETTNYPGLRSLDEPGEICPVLSRQRWRIGGICHCVLSGNCQWSVVSLLSSAFELVENRNLHTNRTWRTLPASKPRC